MARAFPSAVESEGHMVKHIWVSAFLGLLLIGSAGLLSGCNTTSGAGKDISATGHAITHEADENKGY